MLTYLLKHSNETVLYRTLKAIRIDEMVLMPLFSFLLLLPLLLPDHRMGGLWTHGP